MHLVPLCDPDGKRRVAVLREICELARQRDGLVVSGDLFHSPSAAQDGGLRRALKDALSAAAPKPVLLIPGNHDRPGGKGEHPLDGRFDLGSHVRQLRQEPFEEARIGGVGFYGIPFQTGLSGGDLLRRLPPEAEGGVVLLHGTAADRKGLAMYAYDPEDPEETGDCVFRDPDLEAVNAAYFAFGHIHKPETWTMRGGAAAYPGSPDAVTVKDEDARGVLEVDVSAGSAPLVNKLPLKSACRSLRKSVLAAPGCEAEAIQEVETFIKGQPSDIRPAVYLRGLGSGRLLEDGKRSLEALFAGRDPRPVVKLRAAVFGDADLAGSGLLKDFTQAMRRAAAEPGSDSELIAKAALLGWLALRGDERSIDRILDDVGGGHEAR
ncbi:MAG: metallophosphoesterase family protein [Elusimicrobia bacterium]|nr:metallophosphoesterase family protein [Elusimicrobiota bacterium]